MNRKRGLLLVGAVSIFLIVTCVVGALRARSVDEVLPEPTDATEETTWSTMAAEPSPQRQEVAVTDLRTESPDVYYQGEVHYQLSEHERQIIERIVMCEAGGETERGQMMVAQCILEGMLRYDYSIEEYIQYYKVMLTSYSKVTDQVRKSVSRVFDDGERVTEEKADLWYNPSITSSPWHEAQKYVVTVGGHRFFWMLDESDS